MRRRWWIAALAGVGIAGGAMVAFFGAEEHAPRRPADVDADGAREADRPGATARSGGAGAQEAGDHTRAGNPDLVAALGTGGAAPPGRGVGSAGGPGPGPGSAPDAGIRAPGWPTRDMADAAFSGVARQVAACDERGEVQVRVTVRGETGRVMAVDVLGDRAGTPVGTCVRDAVTGALFAPFTTPTFSVMHTFRLGPREVF